MQPPSPFQQSIMVQGIAVGELARNLFPNGILINEDYMNLSGALEHTSETIITHADAIFEGAFIFDNVLVRVDILKNNHDGTFDLIEVKSSTSLKKEHLPDCAVQSYVLQNLGFSLRQICVMYLNREYKRQGELDLSTLFITRAINDEIYDELENVPGYLNKIADVLATDDEPFWNIGSICNNPYICEFKKYCWSGVSEKSIHSLSRITDSKRKQLIDSGITLITEIPDDFQLTDLQSVQVQCEKNQERFIDQDAIKDHLAVLQYPLYFLDFETYGYAIPKYNGTRPYQHLPFQYSLHIKRTPEADLEHYEFLYEKKDNPSRELATQLIKQLGTAGSIVVYYASFEGSRLKEMAAEFSDLATQLQLLHDRLWDLQIPFAKKWYCDSGFNGSASIKDVLPVLVPDLNYSNLEIQKGDVAQSKYLELINLPEDSVERDNIKKALLEYCRLDTLAMVRILSCLQRL
jgi:hypothetical protein